MSLCACCVRVSVCVCARMGVCVCVCVCVCESGWQGQLVWEVGPVMVSQDPCVCPVLLLFMERRMGGMGAGAPPGMGGGVGL